MHLIDSNVAIHLRDKDEAIVLRLRDLCSRPALSIISIVELEGGIAAKPEEACIRRERLDALLARLAVIAFDETVVAG